MVPNIEEMLRNPETLAFKCECDKAAYLIRRGRAYSIEEEALQSDSNRTDIHYYLLSSGAQHISIGFQLLEGFLSLKKTIRKINFFFSENFLKF